MAQIIRITSEALQSTIRRLLPSQQGFGEDLQASNVIQPIIDLTPTAEGSSVPEYLQRAMAHGSSTGFETVNTTSTLVTGGGFYQVKGTVSITNDGNSFGRLQITDGSTIVGIWEGRLAANSGNNGVFAVPFDLVVFLRPTDSLQASSNTTQAYVVGSYRQIADANGVLVNPAGFNPQ